MARPCSICGHSERSAIDRALLGGDSFRNIAERYGTSTTALHRHKREHLAERMVKVAERNADADVRTAIDVVAQLKAINGATLRILAEAKAEGQNMLALQAVDRIQKQIELQAKLIDLLKDGDTINIVVNPQWVELRTVILTALEGHAEARQAVATAMQGVEGGPGHARIP